MSPPPRVGCLIGAVFKCHHSFLWEQLGSEGTRNVLCPMHTLPQRGPAGRGQDWQCSEQQYPGLGWARSQNASKVVPRGGSHKTCAGHHDPRFPRAQCDWALRGSGVQPHPFSPPPATGRGNRRWEGTPVPGGPRPLPPSPSSGCHQGRTQVPADPRKEGCARPIGTKGHGQHSGKKKHLIIRGKAERCAAGGGRKQVSGEAVAAGSGKADRLLPRCPHEAQQNCRGRGGGRTGTHSLSISDHAGQEAGEGSHRPPQSSREASWAGPSPAAHHADPTQGLGAPGLTHPPSSGSHTRCRRQMWS